MIKESCNLIGQEHILFNNRSIPSDQPKALLTNAGKFECGWTCLEQPPLPPPRKALVSDATFLG